jgi:DNA-binding NarL/FixJ family response regulator
MNVAEEGRMFPTRVLVVDSFDLLRQWLTQFLQEHGITVVGAADTAQEAIALASAAAPDIIVTEIFLKDASGPWLLDSIFAVSQAPVIVLTLYQDETFLRQVIARGARGIVQKTETPDTLLQALRTVHAGGSWLPNPRFNPFNHPAEQGPEL